MNLALMGMMALPAAAAERYKKETVPVAMVAAPEVQPVDIAHLDTRTFLQQLIARNLEVRYSRINTDVTRHLGYSEAGLYEPTFYNNFRQEGRNRQRTIEELRLNNAGTPLLDEKVNSNEAGIRGKLPTGAELSLSYKRSNRRSNIIQSNSLGLYDTEYSGLLNLNLKQPLLRNAGRSVTETDRRVAALEHLASIQQLIQQTLKTSIDGLNLYWQLHRAQETVKLRRNALETSKALIADTQARIEAGRAPSSALLELNGVTLSREAELLRGLQGLREAQSKLATALNVLWEANNPTAIQVQMTGSDAALYETQPSLDDMLLLWSPYQIALLRQQQAQLRLEFARNQKKPLLDFVMSYGNTGLAYNPLDAKEATLRGKLPDWYIGFNLEVPIEGGKKAQEQFLAQSARLEQADLELKAIRDSFVNDLSVKLGDVQNARAVLKLGENEINLRQSIFDNERIKVKIGSGLIGNLIQKQGDLIEARQRLLESQIRFEIALATWQYTRGSLLSDNDIQISGVESFGN